jgi:hypothetical protein
MLSNKPSQITIYIMTLILMSTSSCKRRAQPEDSVKSIFLKQSGANNVLIATAEPKSMPELKGLKADIKNLKATYFKLNPNANLQVIEKAEKGRLEEAIMTAVATIESNDATFIFHFSGHGHPHGGLVTQDGLIFSPHDLVTSIRKGLHQKLGRLIIVIDSCYSGNLQQSTFYLDKALPTKEEPSRAQFMHDQFNSALISTDRDRAQNNLLQLDQSFSGPLANQRILFTSSGPQELSADLGEDMGGAFTVSLVSVMAKPKSTLTWQDFANRIIAKTQRLSKFKQTPLVSFDPNNIATDYVVTEPELAP